MGFVKGSSNSSLDPLFNSVGIICWSIDPRECNNSTPAASGDFHAGVVWLPAGTKIANLSEYAKTAGVAITHAWLAIYDANLNLVAQTADNPTAFQATGWITVPLVASYTTPAAGIYYLADLISATTTMPGTLNGPVIADQPAAILPGAVPLSFKDTGLSALPTPPAKIGGSTVHCMLAT